MAKHIFGIVSPEVQEANGVASVHFVMPCSLLWAGKKLAQFCTSLYKNVQF